MHLVLSRQHWPSNTVSNKSTRDSAASLLAPRLAFAQRVLQRDLQRDCPQTCIRSHNQPIHQSIHSKPLPPPQPQPQPQPRPLPSIHSASHPSIGRFISLPHFFLPVRPCISAPAIAFSHPTSPRHALSLCFVSPAPVLECPCGRGGLYLPFFHSIYVWSSLPCHSLPGTHPPPPLLFTTFWVNTKRPQLQPSPRSAFSTPTGSLSRWCACAYVCVCVPCVVW